MRLNKLLVPLTAAAVVGTVLVAPGALFGAATNNHFVGFAGGTGVKALGTTVTSGLTSASGVDTNQTGVVSTNTAATVSVPGIATVGAVTTSVATSAIPGGAQLVSTAKTAGVNLFNGAITADAIESVATAKVVNNQPSGEVHTTLVNLKIGARKFPISVAKNLHVTIPGVANVVINASFVYPGAAGSGQIVAAGGGLYVSLLKSAGNKPIGTEVYVNPVYSAITTVTQDIGATLGGYAYETKITVDGGKLFNAQSGPTAAVSMPIDGTNGVNKVNSTAAVDLGPIAQIGAISSVANGVKSTGQNYSTLTTNLAHVNLLNGTITADALTGVAHVETLPGGGTKATATTSLVNLRILGKPIDVNVSPNTVITIANLARITIRAQSTTASQALVRVLKIEITTAAYGLPVGAIIEVGTAAAWIIPVT